SALIHPGFDAYNHARSFVIPGTCRFATRGVSVAARAALLLPRRPRMFVARWIIDIRFGHKDEALRLMKKWQEEVGRKRGCERTQLRIGSIGVTESRFESETLVDSLDALEKAWAKMTTFPGHARFAQEIEPHVVSGTNRWEIYRVIQS